MCVYNITQLWMCVHLYFFSSFVYSSFMYVLFSCVICFDYIVGTLKKINYQIIIIM